jgi:hypothetical protein
MNSSAFDCSPVKIRGVFPTSLSFLPPCTIGAGGIGISDLLLVDLHLVVSHQMGFLLVVLHQMVLLVAREGLLCKCIFWLPEALLCVVIAIQMGCVLSYLLAAYAWWVGLVWSYGSV